MINHIGKKIQQEDIDDSSHQSQRQDIERESDESDERSEYPLYHPKNQSQKQVQSNAHRTSRCDEVQKIIYNPQDDAIGNTAK